MPTQNIIKQIEKSRKSRVITYITSDRPERISQDTNFKH